MKRVWKSMSAMNCWQWRSSLNPNFQQVSKVESFVKPFSIQIYRLLLHHLQRKKFNGFVFFSFIFFSSNIVTKRVWHEREYIKRDFIFVVSTYFTTQATHIIDFRSWCKLSGELNTKCGKRFFFFFFFFTQSLL